jgi:hypothetical protein
LLSPQNSQDINKNIKAEDFEQNNTSLISLDTKAIHSSEPTALRIEVIPSQVELTHENNEKKSPIQPKKMKSSFALYEMKQKPPSL